MTTPSGVSRSSNPFTLTASHENVESVRTLLFHVNNVIHTRVNILLVVQGLFFATIGTLWGKLAPVLVMAMLGIVSCLMMWVANAALYKRGNALTGLLRTIDPVYEHYMSVVALKDIPVTKLLAHYLPALFLAAWLLVVLLHWTGMP